MSRTDQCKDAARAQTSSGSLCASQDESSDRLSVDSTTDQSGTPTNQKGPKYTFKPVKAAQSVSHESNGEARLETAGNIDPRQQTAGSMKPQSDRNGSVHPMPYDSNSHRILKSIQDSQSGDKSVYQAFKEKHSPKLKDLTNNEAAVLKPQAFKVVEFPDKILAGKEQESDRNDSGAALSSAPGRPWHRPTGESHSTDTATTFYSHRNRGFSAPQAFGSSTPATTNTVVDKTMIPRLGDVVMAAGPHAQALSRSLDADEETGVPTVQDRKASSVENSPKVSSAERRALRLRLLGELGHQHQCLLVDKQGAKLEPPRSLNVREVAKLSKGVFAFPSTCASAESIGPCSLDISSVSTGKHVTQHWCTRHRTSLLPSLVNADTLNACTVVVAMILRFNSHLSLALYGSSFVRRSEFSFASMCSAMFRVSAPVCARQ